MARTPRKPKKGTKSRRSRSTKRSNASTRTSSLDTDPARKSKFLRTATELYSRSLSPSSASPRHEAVVEGVSMWPALRPGYRVLYRGAHPESLSPGDILVIRSLGRRGEPLWRVHRLLGRVGPFFVEAGDNTYTAALVRAEDILGRVELVKDWKGKRVKLAPPGEKLERRFRFFLGCAHAFMFAHECKDRLIGSRRSLLLWRLSQAYRAGLGAAGLQVPTILPER